MSKTVLSAFSQMRLYSYFCLASNGLFKPNKKRQHNLLGTFPQQERRSLLSHRTLYGGNESYVRKMTESYPINLEWKPVTEYYLGLRVKEKWFLRNGYKEALNHG